MATPVYLELGKKRTFACSVDWPGWCRVAKGEEAALELLAAYAGRYAAVLDAAGIPFPDAGELEVVERVPGSGTTDFGAPDAVPAADAAPVSAEEAARFAAVLAASWAALERAAAAAPEVLPKGPRGGGRDRDPIVAHVEESERNYARQVGVRHKPGTEPAVVRSDLLEVLGRPSDGAPLRPGGWPHRYAVRRLAWHVLDHAWELEDKSQ